MAHGTPAAARRFAANNRQIAGVLGLKPTAKQLAEIGEWRARKDFPKKGPKGFGVAELLKWRAAQLEAGERSEARGQRSDNKNRLGPLTSDLRTPTSTPELPPQEEPAEGELFEGVGFEATLDVWEDKLKNPGRYEFAPLQLWQLKQLQVHRPHLFKTSNPEHPTPNIEQEFVDGMDNLGALIMRRFAEFPSLGEVTRQRIQNWKNGIGVVRRTGLVPFPSPTLANRYHVQSAFDWVEKWIVPDLKKPTGELLSGLSARDEMEQIELREARRREQFSLGNLVSFMEVRAFIQATPLRLANALNRIEEPAGFQKLVLEDLEGIIANFQLPIANIPAAAIGDWKSQIANAFGDALAKRCREFNDGLKAEAEEGRRKATEELDKLKDEQQRDAAPKQ